MGTFRGSLPRANEAPKGRCIRQGPERTRFPKHFLNERGNLQIHDFSLGCRRFALGRQEIRWNECALALLVWVRWADTT